MKYHHHMAERFDTALDRMLEVVVLFDHDMRSTLAARGLSISRAHLLWEIHRRGPLSQRELAQALQVTPRNITGLVDGMAADGFVLRGPDPADRRISRVSLTPRGVSTAEEMRAEQQELGRTLFGTMPADTLDGLVRGLDQVLATLRPLIDRST